MKNWACTNIDALYNRMNVDERVENCVFRKLWLLWLCVGIVFFRFCFQASKHPSTCCFVVFQDWIDRDFCFPKIMIMRCYCFLWYEELIIPPRCCFSGKLLCDFVFFSNVLKYWIWIYEYNTITPNFETTAKLLSLLVYWELCFPKVMIWLWDGIVFKGTKSTEKK